MSLKTVACSHGPLNGPCGAPQSCAYSFLFDASAQPGTLVHQSAEEVPRPFVLEPPLSRRSILPGECFTLGLNLFGKGVNYLSHFVLCFLEMGRRGIGERRARFHLTDVSTVDVDANVRTLCRPGAGGRVVFQEEPLTAELADFGGGTEAAGPIQVRFITPLRLMHKGQRVERPDFHLLVRSLLRRLDALNRVYGSGPIEVDFRALIEAATAVRLLDNRTHWFDWERISNRQQRTMRLGGLVGEATYDAAASSFLPLLRAGTVTHMGKATTFGLGQFEVTA